MNQGASSTDRRRRRRAAAALMRLRERLTEACGKFAKVDEWRAFLAQHLSPLLDEFGDVLPARSRGLLEGAADVSEPTQAAVGKACEMLRGGLKSVAEEMAVQTGLQGRIQDAVREALRPLTGLVPDAVAKTTLGRALVALALAAVGAGSIAGVAAVVMSGGDEGGPAQPAVLGASASPTISPPAGGESPMPSATATPTAVAREIDPCSIVPTAAAESVFGEPAQSRPRAEAAACDIWPASRAYAENEDHVHVLVLPSAPPSGLQAIQGVGDEAYWDSTALAMPVRVGEVWLLFEIDRWECGQRVPVTLGETKALAEQALSRLGGAPQTGVSGPLASLPDARALVTKADVEGAFGRPVTEFASSPSSCLYESAGE